ncbi:MAG: hypothetical protein VKI81_05395 [Synechococcaceae cyanobacterium]|nr:hypothetical protein [Synechococcaceae cyanobacterium]
MSGLSTAPGGVRLEALDCWLPGPCGDPSRSVLAGVRCALEAHLRRHPAALEGRRPEPLRWAVTAVDPRRGLRIEGVLLLTDACA